MEVESGGLKTGEMYIMMSGSRAGKSYWTNAAIKRLMDDLTNRPVEDLVLGTGTVYGARYHTIEPIGGNWVEMETWCIKTFGSAGDHIWGEKKAPKPGHRWYMNNRKFWFRNEKDRTMFVLRWT